MKKYRIFQFVLFSLVSCLVTIFFYMVDQKNYTERQLQSRLQEIENLKLNYLKQIKSSQAKIDARMPILYTNSDKNIKQLSEIVDEGYQLGVYIDKSQCEMCWKRAVVFMKDTLPTLNDSIEPFILVSGYSKRDLQMMINRNKIKLPVFLIDKPQSLQYLLKEDMPFYFVLSKEGVLTSVFFPENVYDIMGTAYLKNAVAYCSVLANSASFSNVNVVPLNPNIDIGEVRIREKHLVKLQLKNNGENICKINNVQATCNCVIVDNFPEYIYPGETINIEVRFLSHQIGLVKREIFVNIDGNNSLIKFNLKATVIG